jgi:hypothetical protein
MQYLYDNEVLCEQEKENKQESERLKEEKRKQKEAEEQKRKEREEKRKKEKTIGVELENHFQSLIQKAFKGELVC